MENIYILITVLVTFIISISAGLISYKADTKENYSLLNHFPFELEAKKNPWLTLIFRIILGISIVSMCFASLYLLVFDIHAMFITRVLAGLMIFTSIFMISLFIISFKSLRNHIITFGIFSVCVLLSYLMFGYYTLRDDYSLYPLWITIIAYALALIVLFIMFLPSLQNWYKNKKIKKENGEEVFVRKRINILAFLEWITIFLFVFLFVIIIIGRLF